MKRWITCLLVCLVLSLNILGTVYAEPKPPTTSEGNSSGGGSSEKEDSSGGKLSKEEQQALLDKINGSMSRSASLDNLLSIYSALKSSGIDDEHCSAMLVNGMRESSLVPDAGQDGGGAIGIWQWDGGRRNTLSQFSQEMGDTAYNIKGYSVGGVATQVAFMLKELKGGQWIENSPKGLYGSVNWGTASSGSNGFDFNSTMTIDEWYANKDTGVLSIYFTACFERCAYGIDIYNEGAMQSKDMYKLLTGSEVTGSTNEELDKELGTALVKSGLWSEEQFVSWKEMTDCVLEFSDISEMKQADIANVELWKKDIQHNNQDTFLVRLGRKTCMLLGILFEVWMLFIYLSYWFDRINNFIEVDLLKVMTFGRLRISPTEDECTFRVMDKGSEVRTVNHKTILCICIVGLFFGAFIISGGMFELLNKLVTKVLSFIG